MSEQAFVSFGDVLCLSLQHKSGMLFGEGTTSQEMYLETFVRPEKPVHNLTDGCFELVHRYQYTASKALAKALRSGHQGTSWRTKLHPNDQLYKELAELERRVKDEKETNLTEGRRKLGYPVTYGAVVQFQHESSRKFVTQSKNRAEQDRLAMEVNLIDQGAEGSWWKVLPAEKVRAEGERVHYGDKIILENAKFENSFLFVSLSNPRISSTDSHPYIRLHPSVKARFEVNASANMVAFQVRLVRKHEQRRQPGTHDIHLLGMDVVTFYLRQRDAFLCADLASNTCFWLAAATWKLKSGRAMAGTMWRILHEKVDAGGSALAREGQRVVIQHVASGLYLAQEDGRVVLSEEVHRSKCRWELLAHGAEGPAGSKQLGSGEITWLRHDGLGQGVGMWLSVEEDGAEEGRVQEEGEGGLSDGERAAPSASKAARDTDVLEVAVRPPSEWGSLALLRRCKEVVSGALECIRGIEPMVPLGDDGKPSAEFSPEDIVARALAHPSFVAATDGMRREVCECLAELKAVVSRHGVAALASKASQTYNQDLVREAGLLQLAFQLAEALVDGLRIPVRSVQGNLPAAHAICSHAYSFLTSALHDNSPSKLTMKDLIPTMLGHPAGNFGAYLTVKTIYTGAREMIERVPEGLWTRMTMFIKAERSPRISAFMSEVCHTDDFPIRKNQDRIVSTIFDAALLCTLEISETEAVLVDRYNKAEGQEERINLASLMMVDETWTDHPDYDKKPKEQKTFISHLGLLHLIAQCCFGRNESACSALIQDADTLGLTFEALLAAVKSPLIPDALRQKSCDLLVRLYIDRDPHEPTSLFLNAHVWSGVLYGRILGQAERGTVEVVPDMKVICDEIKENVSSQAQLAALRAALPGLLPSQTNVDDMARNRFTQSLLDCMLALVEFGHFCTFDAHSVSFTPDFDEIKKVVPALLKTLDGRTDLCAPFDNFSSDIARFQESEKTLLVMETKIKVLKLLESFFHCAHSERISRFVQFWERILARLEVDRPERLQELAQSVEAARKSGRPEGKGEGAGSAIKGANGHARRLARVAPSEGREGAEMLGLVLDRHQWSSAPPWSDQELQDLTNEIFETEHFASKNLLNSEFSTALIQDQLCDIGRATAQPRPSPSPLTAATRGQTMFKREGWFVPDFIKVLLDLVRYQHAPLKERSLSLLMATFSAQPNFIAHARSTIFIWEKETAAHFLRVRTDISRLRGLRKAIGSRDPALSRQACAQAGAILEGWTAVCSFPRRFHRHQRVKVQNMLASLGATDAALACLTAPVTTDLASVAEADPTSAAASADAAVAQVFIKVYQFLSKVATGNDARQRELLKHWELCTAHVAALDGEEVVEAMVCDNPFVIRAVASRAIRLAFDAITAKKKHRAGWVSVLMALLKCKGEPVKENLAMALPLFRKSEAAMTMLMKTDTEWDRRIALMGSQDLHMPCGNSQLRFHLRVIRLLALAGEGKNPAFEVYAANYFSLKELLRVLLRPTVDSHGVEHTVPAAVVAFLRRNFVELLHQVYVDPVVGRLEEELMRERNGIWSVAPADQSVLGESGLMPALTSHIQALTELAKRFETRPAESDVGELLAVGNYVLVGVMPMLEVYFTKMYPRWKGQEQEEDVGPELFNAVKELYETPFPQQLQELEEDGVVVDGRESVFKVLDAMMRKSRLGVEGLRRPSFISYEPPRADNSIQLAVEEVAASLDAGYSALVNALAKTFGILDTERLIGTGLLQMTMMLCRDGEVPLYEGTECYEMGRVGNKPKNPKYYEFVMAMLDISRSDTSHASILKDILLIVRGMVYIHEPLRPNPTVEECLGQWQAFLRLDPARKLVEPRGAMLAWVQERLDAMGATAAALRLLGNPDRLVQLHAVSLLSTLLQGCNRRVQRSVHACLVRSKDVVLFRAMSDAVDQALEGLKEHRRRQKVESRGDPSATQRTIRTGEAVDTAEEERKAAAGFGKGSMIMQTLRLIQLLAKRQFTPLQDLMRSGNVNVLQRLVDLLEALQPLLSPSLSLHDGDLAALTIQLLDTLSELLMGPNETNQRYVLGTSFLAVANRMFSSIFLVPLPEDAPKLQGTAMTSNDMRIFLTSSLVHACHAMLEGAASKESLFLSRMLDNFEPRNLYSQLLEAGRVLGLASAEDGSGTDDAAPGVAAAGRQPSTWRIGYGSSRPMQDMAGSVRDGLVALLRDSSGRGTTRSGEGTARSDHDGAASKRKRMRAQASAFKLSKGYEKTVENALFGFYFLCKMLMAQDHGSGLSQRMQDLASSHRMLSSFLDRHSSHVEISHANPKSGRRLVEVVHFRVSKEVIDLTSGKGFRSGAEAQMFDVPRDNPQEKAKAFVKKLHQIRRSIHWLVIVGRHPASRFLIRHKARLAQAPFKMAALITLCLLLFYGIPMDPNTGDIIGGGIFHPFSTIKSPPAGYTNDEEYPLPELTSDPLETGARYGSVLMATDLAVKYRLSLQSRWESAAEWELWPAGKWVLWCLGVLHLLLAGTSAVITMVEELPLAIQNVLAAHHSHPAALSAAARHARRSLSGSAYLEDPPPVPTLPGMEWELSLVKDLVGACRLTLYHALIVALSLLGIISSPLFFVFLTLDFLRTRGGRLVMSAVLHGAPNLLRSFVLGIIVLVCLGFYSYAYFSQSVNINQELCHSPFQCVSKHILDSMTGDLTTVLGDDFGNFGYPALAPWKDSWNSWRSLFILCSIVFWVFLLQGIIQGQIIDAFAEKRNHDFYLKADLEKKCFVSSIDRFVFNAYPGEWEKRRGGQYAWNYLLFFSHLAEKDEEDYNGLENKVWRAFENGDISFLPIEQLAARQRGELEAEDQDLLREVLARVDGMAGRLERLEAAHAGTDALLSSLLGGPADPAAGDRRGSEAGFVDLASLRSAALRHLPEPLRPGNAGPGSPPDDDFDLPDQRRRHS